MRSTKFTWLTLVAVAGLVAGCGGGSSGGAAGEVNCEDNLDNDLDRLSDCDDPDCSLAIACGGPGTGGGSGTGGRSGTGGSGGGATCYTATATLTAPSDTLDGTLATTDPSGGPRGTGHNYDAVSFQGTANSTVEIAITAGAFDTYLYLIGPDCLQLAANDDGGTGTLSSIVVTLPSTGEYTIIVTNFGSSTGTYTLSLAPSTATPTVETSCTDLIDNDADGYTDCSDSNCTSNSACVTVATEICYDAVDNDADGYTDCNDPDCTSSSYCVTAEICYDGVDNDADGYVDCSDSNCAGSSYCVTAEICNDGADNDQDGYTDCTDSDCAAVSNCIQGNCTTLGSCCYTSTATLTVPAGTVSGSLDTTDSSTGPRGTGYYFDDYEFYGTAGSTVTFETTSAAFSDTYLYLMDDTCRQLSYDDDGGATGTLSLLSYTLPYTGNYVIVVTSFSSGRTGTYTMSSY